MKKAYILYGVYILGWIVGLFVFTNPAFADTLYSQPSYSYTATSTHNAYSQSWVAPIAQTAVNNVVNIPLTLPDADQYSACIADVTTGGTCIGNAILTTGPQGFSTYNVTLSGTGNEGNAYVAGNTYRVDVYSQTLLSGITYYTDSSGNMSVVVTSNGQVVNPINWGQLSVTPPIDFNAVKYVATSTSFFSGDASGTLQAIANECSETGNVFSQAFCRASAYLFIPNPNVTNQYIVLASSTNGKFPFSYITGMEVLLGNLQASTTKNMISPAMNFHDIDPASSTPFGHLLPNWGFFSSSTITHFMPVGFWDFVYTFMEFGIWIGLGFAVIREGMHMINVKHSI